MVTLKVGWAMYTDDAILNCDVYEGKTFVRSITFRIDPLNELQTYQDQHYPKSRIYWY